MMWEDKSTAPDSNRARLIRLERRVAKLEAQFRGFAFAFAIGLLLFTIIYLHQTSLQ